MPFPLLIAEEEDPLSQIDEQEEKERKRRHERWQTRIGQGLVAPRRNSLPLDQAEEEHIDGEEAEFEMLGDEEEDVDMTTGRAGSKKTKTKAGAGTSKSVKPSKGKKKEELGPSGMTYTPLEKQVRLDHPLLLRFVLCTLTMRLWCLVQFMEIKAANPDVLLAMEGRSARWAILKPALELIFTSKQSAINSSFMARMQRSPPGNLGSLGQSLRGEVFNLVERR